MKQINVSLIIRTLNEKETIGKCLEAVAAQKTKPKEVLIIDNRSTDSTLEVVDTFMGKLPIKVIDNPVPGFASGLQMGVDSAVCDYVAFLSADCMPGPDWLSKLTSFIQERNCALVFGMDKPLPENDIHYVLQAEQDHPLEPTKVRFFNNTNTLYNVEILKRFLPFKGVGAYLYGEDTIMALAYEKEGYDAYLLPDVIVPHTMFATTAEFKERIYKHAKSCVYLFLEVPTRPRIYLNPIYWVLKEVQLAITRRDARFLKVSYWRFIYTFKGLISGMVAVWRS